ncbi:MAG: FAD-dependent oxidoreductase [Candidatus Gottesmanbacteria bacterium]
MEKAKKIVILGAGPCGLGAAWQLKKLKHPFFHVYEASGHAGGLSSSFIDDAGFTWDIGGHVFHGTNDMLHRLFSSMTKGKYTTYTRHASILIGESLVSYPFQYALSELPEAIRKQCMVGLANNNEKKPPDSFYAWLLATFGSGMAKHFFFPYNEKLWRYPLEKMDWRWISEKIATAHEKHKGTSWGRNARFSVPTVGGIGSVFIAMAKKISPHISYNKQAVAIDAKKRIVTFLDGLSVPYDHLLSTIPLPQLVRMTTGVVIPSAQGLVSCGVAVVGVGIRGTTPQHLKDMHWIYIPSPNIPFFRVSVYSNYGTRHAPLDAWSLLFEVSYDGKKQLKKDMVICQVIHSAVDSGFIPRTASIIDRFYVEAPVAYPIPTKNRDAVLSRVIPALETHNLYSRGRFGSWKYEEGNMDHVLTSGMTWADEIMRR